MAARAQPISPWPGVAAAALVAVVILGTLATVAMRAESSGRFAPGDFAAIRFTLVQAVLSAVLSVGLAVPVARALARRRFRGRTALVALLGAPFILPVIVAVLGLVTVFGRGGWLSGALGAVGLPPLSIYGLHGVVLAHVFSTCRWPHGLCCKAGRRCRTSVSASPHNSGSKAGRCGGSSNGRCLCAWCPARLRWSLHFVSQALPLC